mmetsp:Transcript_11245/g.38354  ORF Transcript_11245/g.38354 Transcript_11245/m.38354 type:complete len:250 (+) Transcript_11245:1736-2485(+)
MASMLQTETAEGAQLRCKQRFRSTGDKIWAIKVNECYFVDCYSIVTVTLSCFLIIRNLHHSTVFSQDFKRLPYSDGKQPPLSLARVPIMVDETDLPSGAQPLFLAPDSACLRLMTMRDHTCTPCSLVTQNHSRSLPEISSQSFSLRYLTEVGHNGSRPLAPARTLPSSLLAFCCSGFFCSSEDIFRFLLVLRLPSIKLLVRLLLRSQDLHVALVQQPLLLHLLHLLQQSVHILLAAVSHSPVQDTVHHR